MVGLTSKITDNSAIDIGSFTYSSLDINFWRKQARFGSIDLEGNP